MDAEFDSTDRECALCYYDLHLSASGCPCSPEKYACLVHAKQLCSCDWDKRFFLFRYDVNELNILADALGGKLSAIHRWGVSDLGLSLSSCVKREKVQDSKTVRRLTDGPRRSYMSQASTVSLVPSWEQKNNENKILDVANPGMNFVKICQEANSASPSIEQTKLGNVSPLKEPCVKNELSCPTNNETSQQQYNGGTGGHKGSAPSLTTPSGQSFPSNAVTRPLITSSEPMRTVHGLGVLKESRENYFQTGDGTASLGEHHSRSLSMIDNGANMKPSLGSSNNSHRLMASDFNAALCHSSKDQVLITSETNTSMMPDKDGSQARTINQQFVNTASGTQSTANQQFVNTVSGTQSASQEALCNVSASKPLIDPSVTKNLYGAFGSGSGSAHRGLPAFGNQQLNERWHQRQSDPLSGVEVRARGHSAIIMKPSLENHSRNGVAQKGPRIANVVHRFKCSVEPIEIGTVLSGRLWSSSQAIFPKGLFLWKIDTPLDILRIYVIWFYTCILYMVSRHSNCYSNVFRYCYLSEYIRQLQIWLV
jgi:histone demethylase JARID1